MTATIPSFARVPGVRPVGAGVLPAIGVGVGVGVPPMGVGLGVGLAVAVAVGVVLPLGTQTGVGVGVGFVARGRGPHGGAVIVVSSLSELLPVFVSGGY